MIFQRDKLKYNRERNLAMIFFRGKNEQLTNKFWGNIKWYSKQFRDRSKRSIVKRLTVET